MTPPRLVLDTNVLVSALLFPTGLLAWAAGVDTRLVAIEGYSAIDEPGDPSGIGPGSSLSAIPVDR